MAIIKLKDLLREHKIIEVVADAPPEVRFVMPYANHAYAKPASDSAGKPYTQSNIDFSSDGKSSESNLETRVVNIVKRFENSIDNPRGGYNKAKKLWFPHKSLEGGSDTIAYGHKIQPGENFSKGLSDSDALKLLEKDIGKKLNVAKSHIKNFDTLPLTVRIATINALYRGDMGPKTMKLLNQNKFADAAKEYLNHREYRSTSNRGVKKRMEWNAAVFKNAS
jgi:hypothetical protein